MSNTGIAENEELTPDGYKVVTRMIEILQRNDGDEMKAEVMRLIDADDFTSAAKLVLNHE